jgi:hypothetical protein
MQHPSLALLREQAHPTLLLECCSSNRCEARTPHSYARLSIVQTGCLAAVPTGSHSLIIEAGAALATNGVQFVDEHHTRG